AGEGAGLLVRSGQATTRAIRHAIEGLVTEPRYAHTAKEVEREMAGYRVEERFVGFVDSVVAASPRDCRGAWVTWAGFSSEGGRDSSVRNCCAAWPSGAGTAVS